MVSDRCKVVVKRESRQLGIHYVFIEMGVLETMEELSQELRMEFKTALAKSGLELMDDKGAMVIEKIKTAINELINTDKEHPKVNFSEYISERLDTEYSHLARHFSEVQGITLEKYLIKLKIEKVKELIIYDRLSIADIAWKLNYSSVAHLSNQFKKQTGLTISFFRSLQAPRLTNTGS